MGHQTGQSHCNGAQPLLWVSRQRGEGKGHSLVSLAGAATGLVTVRPIPARLAMADGSLGAGGLADAMQAVQLAAGLAARHHTGRHPRLGEILQLVVDVEVADAAVEAGAVEELPEAEGG